MIRLLLLLLPLVTACGKLKLEQCQSFNEFGRDNMPNCSYLAMGQPVRFGPAGELLLPELPKPSSGKAEVKILFWGQTLVSGELVPPGEELLSLVHRKLSAKFPALKLVFQSRPVRGVGLRYYEHHFAQLVAAARPDLLITLIEPRMIAADYLAPRSSFGACPVSLLRDFNNVLAAERIAGPLSRALTSIQAKAQEAKLAAHHVWIAGAVTMADMLADLEGCRWMLSFIDQKSINAMDFEAYRMVNELPVLSSREFPIIYRNAVSAEGTGVDKTRLYYQQLSDELVRLLSPLLAERGPHK